MELARAREVLGEMPDRVVVGASGSIIKNVKSVIVPNTDHLKGIPAAAAAGIVAGDADEGVRGNCQCKQRADCADEGIYGAGSHYSRAY